MTLTGFVNLDSTKTILDKRDQSNILQKRDSSLEIIEDKNSKMQKIQEKEDDANDKQQARLMTNAKSTDHSQSIHNMNAKEQLILSEKSSIQKEEKKLAQVSGDDNMLKHVNENILDDAEKKGHVEEVLPYDLDEHN